MDKEYTQLIIKPDGMERNLIAEVFQYLKTTNLTIVAAHTMTMEPVQAANFYIEHQDKEFFSELIYHMSSGPILRIILEGKDAVQKIRDLIGFRDSSQAAPGTIRGDLGDKQVIRRNVVHASDSPLVAMKEIELLNSVLYDNFFLENK